MQRVRALRIHSYGPDTALLDEIALPEPSDGQVLVQVRAAGINGLDWKIRDGLVRDAFPLKLPATLGIEMAGVVLRAAPSGRLRAGARVMAALGGLGAYADVIAIDEDRLTLTPDTLSDIQAAAIPVASVTAWQILRAAGPMQAGQSVLIHGAAGGVGGFAVQFAKQAGLSVLATAKASSRHHVAGLGADQVFDRDSERFEDLVRDVDLVIDLVGGDAVDRSWKVLAPGGALVSAAAPDIAARTPPDRRGIWFMNRPDAEQLRAIAVGVGEGIWRSTIAATVGMRELAAAIETNRLGHAPGKTVVDLSL